MNFQFLIILTNWALVPIYFDLINSENKSFSIEFRYKRLSFHSQP